MRFSRRITVTAVALVVLFGSGLALDPRFLSLSEIRQNVAMGAYVYAPTVLFLSIAVIQFTRGSTWPVVAFGAGLLSTGLFHQYVVGISHGNPGYMFPGGHIAAPFVSGIAYMIAFLAGWGIARSSHRKAR